MKFLSLFFLFAFLATGLFAQQQFITVSLNTPYNKMLEKVFEGGYDTSTQSIKWKASAADLYEFGGTLGDGFLYTKLDTAFKYENSLYMVTHTSSYVKNEDDEMENANSCHACGTHLSLIVFDISDSVYSLSTIKKNIGQHGTFGEPAYQLKLIDLGNGDLLLQIDDSYSGMGVTSITTTFYYYGAPVLTMISKENNGGSYDPGQKQYYEFKTKFVFNKKNQTITAIQTGTKLDENTGKKIPAVKTRIWRFDSYTLQF